jgi:uncharacterized protein (TIGR00725 family)
MRYSVGVVGPGAGADDEARRVAHDVGLLLAERGVVVVTGGLDGVMAAAAEGAQAAGGVVVGLLPGTAHSDGNVHLTVALPTGLGELRNGVVVSSSHALICVGGSWGTLSEVALAMRTGIPVVSIAGWHVTDAQGTEQPLLRATTAAQAVDLALQHAAERVSP